MAPTTDWEHEYHDLVRETEVERDEIALSVDDLKQSLVLKGEKCGALQAQLSWAITERDAAREECDVLQQRLCAVHNALLYTEEATLELVATVADELALRTEQVADDAVISASVENELKQQLAVLESQCSQLRAQVGNEADSGANAETGHAAVKGRTEGPYDSRRKEKADRIGTLEKAYKEFDLDGNGHVGAHEMKILGVFRRKLGHKRGEWTDELNEKMMKAMGMDEARHISMDQFVTYFNEKLPRSPKDFEVTMAQFQLCAHEFRVTAGHPTFLTTEEEAQLQDVAGDLPLPRKNADIASMREEIKMVNNAMSPRSSAGNGSATKDSAESQSPPPVVVAQEVEGKKKEEKTGGWFEGWFEGDGEAEPEPEAPPTMQAEVSLPSEAPVTPRQVIDREAENVAKVREEMRTLNARAPGSPGLKPKVKPLPDWMEADKKPKKNPEQVKRAEDKKRQDIDDLRKQMKESAIPLETKKSVSPKRPVKALPDESMFKLPSKEDRSKEKEERRQKILKGVFKRFDWKHEGSIGSRGLKAVGEARRAAGHKEEAWTESQNLKLLRKIDSDDDGRISEDEFLAYFNKRLPQDAVQFESVVAELTAAARKSQVAAEETAKNEEKQKLKATTKQEEDPLTAGIRAEMKADRDKRKADKTGGGGYVGYARK